MHYSPADDDETGGVSLVDIYSQGDGSALDGDTLVAMGDSDDDGVLRTPEGSIFQGGVPLTLDAQYFHTLPTDSTQELESSHIFDDEVTTTLSRELNTFSEATYASSGDPISPLDSMDVDLTEFDFNHVLDELIETTNRAARILAADDHDDAQESYHFDSDGPLSPHDLSSDRAEVRGPSYASESASSDHAEATPDSAAVPVLNNEDHIMLGGERIDYSILDFLHDWDWQCQMSRMGLVNLTSHRLRGWRPSGDVYNTDLTRRDLQGLDWCSFETTRRIARQTRNALYRHQTLINAHRNKCTRPPDIQHGRYYGFKRTHVAHRPQMMHWQLRNALAATDRNNIFYAARDKVVRTSLACPSMADSVIDMSKPSGDVYRTQAECRITTVASTPPPAFQGYQADSVLIAGGYGGEYAMLNLNGPKNTQAIEGIVSHAPDAINTHIHTLPHRRTGALGAAICSNDSKLRILDISTNTFTHTFDYASELNCATTSPDGRLRALVGDMHETLLTDAETGVVLLELAEHTDHAFACAWSPNGRHLATGAQDGRVLVWDSRNWSQPLAKLDCTLGCARSLLFTSLSPSSSTNSSNDDIMSSALVVAESDDYVSVYDARTWDRAQSVDFFGAVTGLVALDGGRELVVGNGDKDCGGLMVLERVEESGCVGLWSEGETGDQDQDQDQLVVDFKSGVGGAGRRGSKGKTKSQRPIGKKAFDDAAAAEIMDKEAAGPKEREDLGLDQVFI